MELFELVAPIAVPLRARDRDELAAQQGMGADFELRHDVLVEGGDGALVDVRQRLFAASALFRLFDVLERCGHACPVDAGRIMALSGLRAFEPSARLLDRRWHPLAPDCALDHLAGLIGNILGAGGTRPIPLELVETSRR
jgi:hypothetical protein